MFTLRIGLLSGLVFATISVLNAAHGSEQAPRQADKAVTLHFQPATVKPACTEESRHYLIVNAAGYYNSVFALCAKNREFVNFWGWDNGEYTTFTPKMYALWAELPEKI